MADESYENVIMPEEWEIPQEYRYEPLENVQGLYNLKSSSLTKPKERGIFNLGGRKSYDYVPKYLVEAAEQQVKEQKVIEDSGLKPSLKKKFEEEIISLAEEKEAKESYEEMIAKRQAEQKAKYEQAVERVKAEESQTVAPEQKIAEIEKEIVAQAPAATPIAELSDLDLMKNEINALKAQKERLEELRALKLERLKLQLGNIPRGFSEKHPVLAGIALKIGRIGKSIGKKAIEAATPTQEDKIVRAVQLAQLAKTKKLSREQRLAQLRDEFERLTLHNKIARAQKGEILTTYRNQYQPRRRLVKPYVKSYGTYVPPHYRKLNTEAVA